MTTDSLKNKGWTMVYAGLTINLALGILYTWSVFKESIKRSVEAGGEGAFNWDMASLNDPYAVCTLTFALSMILAGKLQDTAGPKVTAFIGGILVSAGFILVSFTTSYALWILGFGLLAGMGIGFGYSSATPPALKWFPPSRTGMVAGIVVSGFGLAPVYIAPLATYLVGSYGLQSTMLIFGIAFLVVVCGAALLLKDPPKDFKVSERSGTQISSKNHSTSEDFGPKHMLRTPVFYMMWLTFFISSGAGLMVIANISGMAKRSMGEAAFVAVAIMAVGNASGRIIAGMVSDRIGRILTLSIIILLQAALMFVSIPVTGGDTSAVIVVLLATFIGFNYGTNLSLFPSLTKGIWGLKNFGLNYGILMSAWGFGGFVFSRISQWLASTGRSDLSFQTAGISLLTMLAVTWLMGKARH